MLGIQFKRIKYFTREEIEATGCNIKDLKYRTMKMMDNFRHKLGRRVHPLVGGITTGKHSSPMHPNGKAFDFTLYLEDGELTNEALYQVVRCAVDCGFRGVGIYKNTEGYTSFHLDRRRSFSVWIGRKNHNGSGWIYSRMLWGEPGI